MKWHDCPSLCKLHSQKGNKRLLPLLKTRGIIATKKSNIPETQDGSRKSSQIRCQIFDGCEQVFNSQGRELKGRYLVSGS